ncbi:MAG: hypothetical protein HY553_11035 [Elusimicrobia bacterium]|nr:hypothetical protein [Elusimicrobiota bacterium]
MIATTSGLSSRCREKVRISLMIPLACLISDSMIERCLAIFGSSWAPAAAASLVMMN